MRPTPTDVDPTGAHDGLRHVRQEILQIRVAGADHQQLGHCRVTLPGGLDQAVHAH